MHPHLAEVAIVAQYCPAIPRKELAALNFRQGLGDQPNVLGSGSTIVPLAGIAAVSLAEARKMFPCEGNSGTQPTTAPSEVAQVRKASCFGVTKDLNASHDIRPLMQKSKSRQEGSLSLDERLGLVKESEHRGAVKSTNPRQKVSDEELIAIFNQMKGKWHRVEDLREALAGLITINSRDPKRTPINSAYLRRLRHLTGNRWRQKRGVDAEGRILVKVYVRKG